MPVFRKKPVEVEAVRVLPANDAALLDFFGRTKAPFEVVGPWTFVIHTLEGDMTAEQGDWLICGVKGEVYPCKHDIFELTYDLVSDA